MLEQRGLVVHIASGFYGGTIEWERNPDANVSSHFVLGRAGQLAQLVDTDVTAWTQRAGNGHWLSVECEGFALDDPLHSTHPGWEQLTAAQLDAIAWLLVHGHQQYGYPLQLAGSPTGRGLGYHSMGAEHGYNWGHLHCPGESIKAQLPTILARAQVLAGTPTGGTMGTAATEDIMNREINGRRVADILGAVDPMARQGLPALADQVASLRAEVAEVLTAVKALGAPVTPPGVPAAAGPLSITLTGTAVPAPAGP